MRTGGVEPPQPEGGITARRARRCSASAGRSGRTDSNRHREDHHPECCRYTTATRAGTTGIEPAACRLTSERSALELRAPNCAGGIRTHGLELMRGRRGQPPLPRCANKKTAGGVEPAVSGARSPAGGLSPTAR